MSEHKCCPGRGCGNCGYCYGDCEICCNLPSDLNSEDKESVPFEEPPYDEIKEHLNNYKKSEDSSFKMESLANAQKLFDTYIEKLAVDYFNSRGR